MEKNTFPTVIPGMTPLQSMQHEYQACLADAYEQAMNDNEEDRLPHVLEVLAYNCHKCGLEEGFAVRRALFNPMLNGDADYVQAVFDNQYRQHLNRQIPLGSLKPTQLLMFKTEAFMNSRYELRKNVMTGVAQYRFRNGSDYSFADLTKEVMNSMSIDALKAGIESWDKDIRRYIESTKIPEYDPVNDWLAHLPKWDGRDRVTAFARRVPTDNTHWEKDFHIWMLSMVAHWTGRDRSHGNAIVPLLIGKQGCGKSSFCNIILPPDLRDYYNDRIDLKNDMALNLALTSFALINIDEFDKTTRAQQPLLKYLISKNDVKMRPPYGKAFENRRRYASFIGTTNCRRPLTDKSGGRRFLCAEMTGNADFTSRVNYPQLYAQLLSELHGRRRYWLTDADNRRIIEQNRRFLQVENYEQMLLELLKEAPADAPKPYLTINEIVDALEQAFPNFRRGKNANREVGTCLSNLGFEMHKTSRCNVYKVALR